MFWLHYRPPVAHSEPHVADPARDALAWFVRVIGRTGPDGGEGVFASRAADVGSALESADAPSWPALRTALAGMRTEEHRGWLCRVEAMRDVVRVLAEGLGDALAGDARLDVRLDDQLCRLRAAADHAPAGPLRDEVVARTREIASLLRERRASEEVRITSFQEKAGALAHALDDARREVLTDPLTGVGNRRAYESRVRDVCAMGGPATLLVFDVDHFKAVNDGFGHPAGDAILRGVGDALRRTFQRRGDFACRFGGDEFVVVVTGASPLEVRGPLERFLDTIRELRVEGEWGGLGATVSVGMSPLLPGDDPVRWLARADSALLRAKGGGRDQVVEAASP